MIVTTGKHIIIELGSNYNYILERKAETPGIVTVKCNNGSINLPGNQEEAERFIKAYRRALSEDIAYRKSEVE